jgi:hypothetical protein
MHRIEFNETHGWLERVTVMPCTDTKNLEQMQN